MKKNKFDFGGWATKNDLLCADGRTIRRNAFKDDDGRTVPLVYQHNHDDPTRVIGHALLENRDEGVYAYCSLNQTDIAQHVKECVRHGDIRGLSIFANKLTQHGGDVTHGVIRELSIVLAGANPGAVIEFPILEHGEESTTEAYIWSGEEEISFGEGMKLKHSDDEDSEEDNNESNSKSESEDKQESLSHAEEKKEEPKEKSTDDEDETIQDVLDSMNEKQRKVVEYLVAQALGTADDEEEVSHSDTEEDDENADDSKETIKDVLDSMNAKQRKVTEYLVSKALGEDDNAEDNDSEASHSIDENESEDTIMEHNLFDNSTMNEQDKSNTLTHDQLAVIAADAKKLGSMREAVVAHSAEYGIEQIDYLMPEYREFSGNGAPAFIKRDMTWVDKIMSGVHHTPFAKVKTTFADITGEEARARGYMKGNRKKEEVFGLLKREISPDTVYKKQKIDRDDAIDLSNGFDMVAWLKGEMRMMLNEELARAFIIGDGRPVDSDDKIKEDKIRPVFKDDSLFVIRRTIGEDEDLIDAVTYASEEYQGSGNCVALMTRRQHSKLKLMKNKFGERIYKNDSEIASALGVRELIFVPQLADASTVRVDATTGKTYKPLCIILDLDDYNVGADKGGSINMFEDFDIDYNQMKYLIETRCSGALVKPFSAIVIEEEVASENP